ncbi:MAG: hypothetical protein AAFN08_08785, partial [Cyanobacteria bacterium J06559_3]
EKGNDSDRGQNGHKFPTAKTNTFPYCIWRAFFARELVRDFWHVRKTQLKKSDKIQSATEVSFYTGRDSLMRAMTSDHSFCSDSCKDDVPQH